MNKKAVMGIGALIIFIAGILAATIGAGVILYTQNRLQSEALKTGADARESIGTSVLIDSIRAFNIENAQAEHFMLRTKLGAGSSPINLNQTSLLVISRDSSNSLAYGGVSNEKYFTNKVKRIIKEDISNEFIRLRSDIDNDNIEDYIRLRDSTTLEFNLSSIGIVELSIPDISTIDNEINFSSIIPETNSNIKIIGTVTQENILNQDIKVIILPEEIGKGIFTIDYLIRGKDIRDSLMFGDIIRIYFETAAPVREATSMHINFYTSRAVTHSREVITPTVMTSSTITLYP